MKPLEILVFNFEGIKINLKILTVNVFIVYMIGRKKIRNFTIILFMKHLRVKEV